MAFGFALQFSITHAMTLCAFFVMKYLKFVSFRASLSHFVLLLFLSSSCHL